MRGVFTQPGSEDDIRREVFVPLLLRPLKRSADRIGNRIESPASTTGLSAPKEGVNLNPTLAGP